jgi:hypothetical protein
MKKFILLAIVFIAPFVMIAQDETAKDTIPNGWTRAGNISLLFNQAAFNHEWTGGGTSNIAGNLGLTYDFNYKQDKLTWNNRIIAEYGLTKNKDDQNARKTNDRLELNSIIGRQINESNWYYSFFLNFKTQMTSGYAFDADLNQNDPNYRTEVTKSFSPAYLQLGPGMLWKKNNNLYVNIAPATARLIFVNKDFTNVGNDPLAIAAFNENPYFGVEANETMRFEFGAAVSAYAKLNLMENISMENILNLYSNYLEDPQNVDIDYTMNLLFKVNSYISANATFQAIYDDNAVQGFQIREALGIGVTYGF